MFVPRYYLGDLDLTDAPFLVLQGEDRGAPQNVAQVIDSMLQDGEWISVSRRSNRTMAYTVYIEESDLQACAEAEEALLLECNKPTNTFSIDPGDDLGAVTVFDTFTVQATFVYDPDAEAQCLRRYDLTWQALPFARAETATTIPALASGVTPASTTIADGSSATNWTGTTAVTASGGTLRQTVTVTSSPFTDGTGTSYTGVSDFIYTPGAPITAFATENYLSVDVILPTGGAGGGSDVTAFADGVELESVALLSISGGTRWIFQCTDASVSVLKISVTSTADYLTGGGSISSVLHQIDNVTTSNQAPSTATTTGREALRTIAVPGSARTPASLAIEHETLGLGKVLIHSHPALAVGGYSPDLRRLRVSGSAESTSSATVSGATSAVDTSTPEVFRVPTSSLPRGGFLLLALASGVTDFTDVEVTSSTRLSTGALIGTTVTRNKDVQTINGFAILASLTLPPTDVPSSSDSTVELAVLSMAGTPAYDEMFLCAMGDDAALTLVDCGAGTSATLGTANNRLWVDSASIDRPTPTIWLGSAAGKADAYHAGGSAGSWMPHQFTPPLTTLFVANSGGANPAISTTLFERAHTHIVNSSE